MKLIPVNELFFSVSRMVCRMVSAMSTRESLVICLVRIKDSKGCLENQLRQRCRFS